jgi:hypothetical protein
MPCLVRAAPQIREFVQNSKISLESLPVENAVVSSCKNQAQNGERAARNGDFCAILRVSSLWAYEAL